jgi:hypothetical protein
MQYVKVSVHRENPRVALPYGSFGWHVVCRPFVY